MLIELSEFLDFGFDGLHFNNDAVFYVYCKEAKPGRLIEVMEAFDLEECEPVGRC